ncbi:hypothetical protein V2O64_25100 (plasmid) [Verrucomicrobiaceae bacterium 227]
MKVALNLGIFIICVVIGIQGKKRFPNLSSSSRVTFEALGNDINRSSRRDLFREPRASTSSDKASTRSERRRLLSDLAAVSPDIFRNMIGNIYDQNLNVNLEETEFLGLNSEEVQKLSVGMKEIFKDLQESEIADQSYETLENGKLVALCPALNDESAKNYRDRISDLFNSSLEAPMAEGISQSILTNQRPLFASISGLDRRIEIDQSSDETFELTKHGGEIVVTYSDASRRPLDGLSINQTYPPGYIDKTEQIFVNIPFIYSHLFGEKVEK